MPTASDRKRRDDALQRLTQLEAEIEGIRRSLSDWGLPASRADAVASMREAWIPVPDPAPWAPPTHRPASAAPARPAQDTAAFEAALGLRWLPMVGAAVVALGMALFVVLYGAGIPATLRFAVGLLAGAGLWAWGRSSRPSTSWLGDACVGAGAALAYYSFFAASVFPAYGQGLGLPAAALAGGMAIVAAALAADSLWRGREPLAALALGLSAPTAWVAGAPSLLSPVHATLLACAIALLAERRGWERTAMAAIASPALQLSLLAAFAPAATTLACAALLVATAAALPVARQGERTREERAALQAIAWLGASLASAIALPADWRGPFVLAAAAAALAAALAARRVPALRAEAAGAAIAGLVLAWAWPLVHLEADHRALGYAALAGLSVALLRKEGMWSRAVLWTFAGTAIMAGLSTADTGVRGQLAGFGVPWAALLAVAGVGLAAWWLDRRAGPALSAGSLAAGLTALVASCLLVVDGVALTLAWAILAALVLGAGFLTDERALRLGGLAMFAPVLLRLLGALAALDPFWRVVAFMAVGILLLAASLVYRRRLGLGA